MAKVLIVDDAEFLRMRISKVLLANGHTVVEADNGLNAVSTYTSARPDVVLMDITMPEMDGLMALKEIKALDPQARVVMLTALGQDSVVLEAMRFGALDFLLKPFESNRVLSTVNKALSAPITA
jgi:two-component system chemotaxis response regulator CheY